MQDELNDTSYASFLQSEQMHNLISDSWTSKLEMGDVRPECYLCKESEFQRTVLPGEIPPRTMRA